MKLPILLALILAATTACSSAGDDDVERAKSDVSAFATAYFNYDLHHAMRLSTPSSARWLRFLASNLTGDDLEVLRSMAQDATVEVTGLTFDEARYGGVATVRVHGGMVVDSIGRPGHIVPEAQYELRFVRGDGRFVVKMEGLPRSEMPDRD